MIAFLSGILRWLVTLGPWLRGIFPWMIAFISSSRQAWTALKLPIRIAIIAVALALFPLPDFLEELPARIGTLPAPFDYFAGLAQLRFGFAVIGSAYVFRWMWRIFRRGD